MGVRGPAPKRSDQRRRSNSPDSEQVVVTGAEVVAPPADADWHPVAKSWYEALAESGQSIWYEPSDWATAALIAESMSRELKPQVVGIKEDTGEPVFAVVPIKGAALSSYLKAMTVLLVTEGDRRRARVELQRVQPGADEDGDADGVAQMDDYRSRFAG